MVTAAPARILLVEDDPTVADVVIRYLAREGFDVTAVGDGATALERTAAAAPDLVVLDLMLPGVDGLEVCRRLRERGSTPIVMLTARGEEEDRIVGLEHGADDYVAKPFSPRELTARVKAVLRRSGTTAPAARAVDLGDLHVDPASREVRVRGETVELTAREFDLLAFLAAHPRTVFRREELLEQVWGWSYGDASTVTVHVRRLREKIEEDPSSPRRIVTVWGVGYRLDP